ncbi:C4-type zinc ribbon domain-containing protein [Flavobacteriales bacterium]|nr:C4-type zinc ribbon domain-containing protein [Flavobacteriales bacterium]MDG1395056.1 C4-type zinc ribbon domain-containing protein [Flavobacteriales bacterium]
MAKAKQSTVEEKLIALYTLQSIDTEIDKIKILRGELPLEVQDLEDEIAGLQTRVTNINDEIAAFDGSIKEKESLILDSKALMKKYDEQLKNIRNNREFDSLNKEIEFQTLEIELAEKRIKEAKASIVAKMDTISGAKMRLQDRSADLDAKNAELDSIIAETKKDEEKLGKQSVVAEKVIDERLLNAYKRLRGSVRNGLAVVPVLRDACGGCFNSVPPQRQMDIASRKKVIVCEHCGRVLVDKAMAGLSEED